MESVSNNNYSSHSDNSDHSDSDSDTHTQTESSESDGEQQVVYEVQQVQEEVKSRPKRPTLTKEQQIERNSVKSQAQLQQIDKLTAQLELAQLKAQLLGKEGQYIQLYLKDKSASKEKRIAQCTLNGEIAQLKVDISQKELDYVIRFDNKEARVNTAQKKLKIKQAILVRSAKSLSSAQNPKARVVKQRPEGKPRTKNAKSTPESVISTLSLEDEPNYPVVTVQFCKLSKQVIELILSSIGTYDLATINRLRMRISNISIQLPKAYKDVYKEIDSYKLIETLNMKHAELNK